MNQDSGYAPNVDESFRFDIGNFNLPEDDSPIRRRRAPHKNQIGLHGEIGQGLVGQPTSPCPHFGLVFVPVTSRFLDLVFDGPKDSIKCLDGVFARWMGIVEAQLLC